MLATAVGAIVIVAVQTVFFGALRLRNTTDAQAEDASSVHRTLELVRRDLAGLLPPGGALSGTLQTAVDLSFSGPTNGQRVSPDLYTTSARIDARTPFSEVQRVSYYLVPSSGGNSLYDLVRASTRNLLPTAEETLEEQTLIGGVRSASFEYFDGGSWTSSWDSTATSTMPIAIRFTLQRGGTQSGQTDPAPIETVVPVLVGTATAVPAAPTTEATPAP